MDLGEDKLSPNDSKGKKRRRKIHPLIILFSNYRLINFFLQIIQEILDFFYLFT